MDNLDGHCPTAPTFIGGSMCNLDGRQICWVCPDVPTIIEEEGVCVQCLSEWLDILLHSES
jgi:hypothetical protein